ncbi:MAG: PASTA domain-containing protein [Methanophagales archaeon]|nr:PASTA domain-containing protein [Methanophagales archaeon]
MALVAFVIVMLLTLTRPVTLVEVPDIVGYSRDDAEKIIKVKDLIFNVKGQTHSDTVQKYKVTSQDPPAGLRVKKGSTVDVVISIGPQITTTPQPTITSTATPTETSAPSQPTITPTGTPPSTPSSEPSSELTISPSNIEQVTQLASINTDWVNQLAWSPDGKLLAVATYNIYLYDSQTWESTNVLDLQWVSSIAFSPDGRLLASGGYGEMVRLWGIKP